MSKEIKFSVNFKRLRKERKLTQIELSKKLNIIQPTISNYEVGEAFPTFESLVKIAKYFEVSLEELVYGLNTNTIKQKHNKVDDILKTMPLNQIIMKYNILIDGRKATSDEARLVVNAIRFDRFNSDFKEQ